ncbi:MAG TPA: SURF1 family protein [Micavibrio sp.]|nr:SURF1 family protein [Micavibrio sp.]
MKLPLGPTVMTISCIAILASLGTWQVKRLEWKNAVIAKLNDSYAHAAPLSEAQLAEWSLVEEPLGYGSVHGRLQRDKAVLLGPRTEEGRVGYHLLLPLALDGGGTLIVNTGWVSDLWKDNPDERLAVLPAGPVTVKGGVHKPDWSSFASKNSPVNDMWFRADIGEIAEARGIEDPYPFILYADKIAPELPDVEVHEEHWLPRNKHLQYAIFWYALAVAMLGVYGFYIVDLNKKKGA